MRLNVPKRVAAFALILTGLSASPAFAADLGRSAKSLANPVSNSISDLANPSETPNVAELIDASRPKADDAKWASPDSSYHVSSQSDGSGSYNVQIKKKLFSF